MRICFYNVTASFIPGGLETYCWEVGRALSRRGHEVTLVAGDRSAFDPAANDAPRHDEMAMLRFPFRIEQSWPDFGHRFQRLMERLSFARGGGLAHLVQAKYDAVIINKPFDFPVLWQARRRGMKSRTLFRSGGTDFYLGDKGFQGAIDHWVSSSRYNAAQIEGRYGRKVTVIHNGVDTDHFTAASRHRERAALPEPFRRNDAFIIVSVGRLTGWKALHVIIDALVDLPPQVCYLVIGEGDARAEWEARAAQAGVAERVCFAGRIGHAVLPEWLALADVFVQPSIGEEAFGISVVEAMACGLPVLASLNGGLPEIVIDGETGRLLPPGDVAAWRSALGALLAGRDQRLAWAAAARQRVIDHFTWAANAAAHERMLEAG